MSLKNSVDKIYTIKTGYAFPEQALDQAESLSYLSDDLYTDSKRFIYELIQNADDAYSKDEPLKIWIYAKGIWLIVAHTGKPFTDRDVRGLCGVNDSNKKLDVDKTGYKGIGFKAVFSKSDYVIVHSQENNFRFDKTHVHPWRKEWGLDKEEWEKQNDREFKFPWQLTPIWTPAQELPEVAVNFINENSPHVATIIKLRNADNVKDGIEELVRFPLMLLFLRNISEIKFDFGKQVSITKTHDTDKGLTKVIAPNSASEWLLKTVTVNVPLNVREQLKTDVNVPPKLLSSEKATLTLAARHSNDGIVPLPEHENLLFSFLPTETRDYKFPVLVNSTFITNSNRQQLHQDSVWNQWLFKHLPTEILTWISELATYRGNKAYHLIPDMQRSGTGLALKFNDGFEAALGSVRFLLNKNRDLLLRSEALMDFTMLSGAEFVGAELIRNFMDKKENKFHSVPWVDYAGVKGKMESIGVKSFGWSDFIALLSSSDFRSSHNPERNISMIQYLFMREQDDQSLRSTIQNSTFLLDHKRNLLTPGNIYLPAPDDKNWNLPDSEISYLHPQVQEILKSNFEIQTWLENLGVSQKTDLSFLDKTIIPKAGTFIDGTNALEVVRWLFGLFLKGTLGKDRLKKLGRLKLLTEKGTLIPAHDAYLSDAFNPKLHLQSLLQGDIFVSKKYITSSSSLTDLRTFFTLMDVAEEITPHAIEQRLNTSDLETVFDVRKKYFDEHKFTPFLNTFDVRECRGLITLTLLSSLSDFKYGQAFWSYVVKNISVENLVKPATVYWGYEGHAGMTTGDEVANYIPWFVSHVPSLPTIVGKLDISPNIFLNNSEIEELAGNYLPVIDLDELTSEWKAFFKFKTELQLSDYLIVLKHVTSDLTESGTIKDFNRKRVQDIYSKLLELFPNFSDAEQTLIKETSKSLKFPTVTGVFKTAGELNHFAEGDASMFDELFEFVYLNRENRKNGNIDGLLSVFGINMLRMSDFTIEKQNAAESVEFKQKIANVISFFAKWLAKFKIGEYDTIHENLKQKLSSLKFSESESIEIIYNNQSIKRLYAFDRGKEVGFTRPWSSGRVMLELPTIMAKKLGHKEFDKELNFLLREPVEEIKNYFRLEGIELPEEEVESTLSGINSTGLVGGIEMIDKGIDYDVLRSQVDAENSTLLPQEQHDPVKLMLDGIEKQTSQWKGHIYHFTHIENAIKILREGLFKSRARAVFKDSASSRAIGNTDAEKQEYVRCYFRPQTPTQYYNENLGRGSNSKNKLGSDPVCPVPVFFVIPMEEVLNQGIEWAVSLGNMARKGIEFGNTEDVIRHFDFNGVYLQPFSERYFASSQQEFLVRDQLKLSGLNFKLICQDESSYETLRTLLEGTEHQDRISINSSFFHHNNDRVIVSVSGDRIDARLTNHKEGFLVMQVLRNAPYEVQGDLKYTFETDNKVTFVSEQWLVIQTDFARSHSSLFYAYNGELWLIHSNEINPVFSQSYLKSKYLSIASSKALTGESVVTALSLDPKMRLLYDLGVGGPDGLTLKEHTINVIENYLNNFQNKFGMLLDRHHFILMLGIHDVGKPVAMMDGKKSEQHRYTLRLASDILSAIVIEPVIKQTIETIVGGDPIGKYLDERYCVSLEDTINAILEMAEKLSVVPSNFLLTLMTYYQCDAGGYASLKKRLFVYNGDTMLFDQNKKRIVFHEPYESKIKQLEEKIY